MFTFQPFDDSIYRQKIKDLADKFIDLAELSNAEASEVIRLEEIDILLDMQLHTLGHRLHITAAQPAPVQMNYLVYPGTSGASFLQYLVTDRVVTPAQHAAHYSEAFLMLPSTYQISFYDRYVNKYATTTATTAAGGAAPPTVTSRHADRVLVLCNFNKIDKFDSDSFTIWTQVMSRFPASVFRFVIDTRKEVVHNIHTEFALRGVHPNRVAFLPRVSKEEHIRRHQDMDLFVDSLVYGAHSTATDALRGGLPVLTLEGETFPQRVGASLLESLSEEEGGRGMDHGKRDQRAYQQQKQGEKQEGGRQSEESLALLSKLLCTFSKKSFEDVAVKLLQSPVMLQKLRNLLLQASGGGGGGGGPVPEGVVTDASIGRSRTGFFHTENRVRDFLRGMQAAAEVEQLQLQMKFQWWGEGSSSNHDEHMDSKRAHIIVTNQ